MKNSINLQIAESLFLGLLSMASLSCGTIPQPPNPTNHLFNVLDSWQSDYALFPGGFVNGVYYDSQQKVVHAFTEASTTLYLQPVSFTLADDSSDGDYSSLLNYVASNEGGLTALESSSDSARLYGLMDVRAGIETDNYDPTVEGITYPKAEGVPALSFVLGHRIKIFHTELSDQVQEFGYVSTHELGHARGITGDSASICPPHSGSYSSTCVMRKGSECPSNCPDRLNPVFCDGHANFIKGVSW